MSTPKIIFVLDEEDLKWTPEGMTPAQALELPQVLLQELGEMPSHKTTRRLEWLRVQYIKDEHLKLADIAVCCIKTAKQVMSR